MTRTPEPVSPVPAPVAASRTVLLCTGTEAREAARALAKIMPKCSVEDAALVSMAGAARKGDQVVLIVDCHKDGLSDGANGLSTLLAAAPAAMQAQLRKLKFGLLTVVCDTSERDKAEIAKAADPLSKNLAKYGATCVSTHCLDLKDMNDDTMSNVCAALKTSFGMDATPKQSEEPAAPALMRAAAAAVLPPAGTTQVRLAAAIVDLPEEVEADPADVRSRYYFEAEECKITKVRQLRQQPALNEGLSTIEVEMEAKGKLAEYALGGTLSLLPENDPEDILKILSLLSFSDAGVSRALTEADLDKSITFAVGSGVNYKRPFPTPCTLRKALSLYCDLSRPPTKKMLTALSLKMQDAGAKSRVEMLLKDTEMLKSLESSVLCLRMHEFWALMSIDGLDLCEFLLHCPRQKAREFTIASSPAASPGKIGLCVALTSHEQPSLDAVLKTLQEKGLAAADTKSPERSQRFFGACSSWLNSRLKSGAAVFAKTHASPLTLPKEDVPIIMIGAGAGVAPFKGFWDELRKSSKTAPAMLFFGCRHPDKDWLFRDEMNGAVKMGAGCGALARMKVGPKRPLAAMYPAFSRPDNESEKKYVQDQLREQAGMVTMAIENKGYIFICGSSAMGKAVLDTLGETIEGGKEAVEDLRKNGRIVAEMWG
jgi:sulfite reductase alpha subunit-like flavoprotein